MKKKEEKFVTVEHAKDFARIKEIDEEVDNKVGLEAEMIVDKVATKKTDK